MADGVQDDRNPTPSHIALYLPALTASSVQRRTLTLAAELAGQGQRIDRVTCESERTLSDQVPPQVKVVCPDPEPLWCARCAALAANPKGLGALILPVLLAQKPSRWEHVMSWVSMPRREAPRDTDRLSLYPKTIFLTWYAVIHRASWHEFAGDDGRTTSLLKVCKLFKKNAVINAPMAPVPQELHMPVSDHHCQDYRRHHDYRRSHLGKGDSYHEKFTDQVYRAIIWDLEQRILSDVMQRHFSAPGHVRLLDFACGTGRILGLFENRVATSTGVDVAPSMLGVAARNLGRSRLLCNDITKESTLDGECFDLITAFRFFPNAEIELRHEAMVKLIELLAPGGRLIFNNHLRSGSARHRRLMAKDRRGRLKNKRALHSMDDEEALGLAADHGLTMLEEHHLGLLPVLRDRKPLRWHALALPIERLAARMKLLAPLAGYKIYVLSKDKVPC